MIILTRLIYLLAGHALCDYPWQGQYLSDAKSHKLNPHGWRKALFAHAVIHAGMVLFITHNAWFAIAEFVIHAITDYAKCDDRISSDQDQSIHYVCKILWAVL